MPAPASLRAGHANQMIKNFGPSLNKTDHLKLELRPRFVVRDSGTGRMGSVDLSLTGH
jgi:hypothetical protein